MVITQKLETVRRPLWIVDLLDEKNRLIRSLDEVLSGSIELSATTKLGGSGTLTISGETQIDWLKHRVRITYNPGIAGVTEWAVATMLFSSPTMKHNEHGRTYEVALLSTLAAIDEDTTDSTYSLAAGTPIIDTVIKIVRSAGATQIAATPSPATLRSSMMWPAGTSKLKIANELLDAANYWSLKTDGYGRTIIAPYTKPSARTPKYKFKQGDNAIHSSEWTREQDNSSVPNQCIITTSGDDKTPALVGIARNENPNSPYSYQARGRWITMTEEVSEIATQEAANALAARWLLDRMTPVARISVQYAILPLEPDDAIEFSDSGHNVKATVQRMSFDLSYDSLCRADWRETINVG